MKKKLILVVTALTLCAAIAVGGTLAYLSAQSEALTNEFTYNPGGDDDSKTSITIELAEPAWSKEGAYQFKDEPVAAAPTTNGGYGIEKALKPGSKLNKNPQLKLKSQVDSFVGLGIQLEGMTWAEFDELFYLCNETESATKAPTSHSYNPGWKATTSSVKELNGARYYVYTPKLSTQGEKSTPLFTTVYLKGSTNQARLDELLKENNGFKMIITGYAAQGTAEDQESWDAVKALQTAFADTFQKFSF